MSIFNENFKAILDEENIPYRSETIEDGHNLYVFGFMTGASSSNRVEVIVPSTEDDVSDAQIIYRGVHMLGSYEKRNDALDVINELNEMRTGYYNLHLSGDGEMYMRALVRVGSDMQPFYQTLLMGARIVAGLRSRLIEVLGESAE